MTRGGSFLDHALSLSGTTTILENKMDLEGSDEEELPTTLETTSPIRADFRTVSTLRSSILTDRTVTSPSAASPRTARKRTNEEIYQRPQKPRSSTTPLKTPPRRMSQWESSGFGSQDTYIPESSPMSSPEPEARPEATAAVRPTEQPLLPKNFVQSIQEYQKQLDDEFTQFQENLKKRDKKDGLDDLDWDDLERQYFKEIGPKEADEHEIMERLQTYFNVCNNSCLVVLHH